VSRLSGEGEVPVASSFGAGHCNPSDLTRAGTRPRWRNDLGVLSIPLALLAVVFTASGCLLKAPGAVYSFCGTCRGLARLELESQAAWAGALCLASWLMARASRSRPAARVARSAGAACAGMWAVAWGFVLGWW
jgi:hypothetical protein